MLLSICIPTCGRVKILRKTLESIYSQDYDCSLYEVCISDNSQTNDTELMLKRFFADKNNLIYKKSTCEGYYNSVEALKLGHGVFLKLHNNYSRFNKDSLKLLIEKINLYANIDSVLFFTSGYVRKVGFQKEFDSFNSFLNCITYYSTWSTSFGIWKRDFDLLLKKNLTLDKMFPHTSLLFCLINKKKYIVDNYRYFNNQDVGKKGGYNLPETFGNRYLSMCLELLNAGCISDDTFEQIKKDILKFISEWYLNTRFLGNKYCFSFENWEKIILDLYGPTGVAFIKNYYKRKKMKFILKRILSIIINK